MGSSPLTRGKRRRASHGRLATGLIPAHAGKTRSVPSTATRSWAHPRSRGENLCSRPHHESASGSSPLTRGKLSFFGFLSGCFGLIPAHAGKTTTHSHWPIGCRAHPRSRGENWLEEGCDALDCGSSPLTRGKLVNEVRHPSGDRLIPAHAGKTRRAPSIPRPQRAHPRSRGENQCIRYFGVSEQGSSPLTRGKRVEAELLRLLEGLIPAHAGKTPHRSRGSAKPRAHPRSRGENVYQAVKSSGMRGSSPLTRGKRTARIPSTARAGLIPAHAGKTT